MRVHPELAPILDRLPDRPEHQYADVDGLRRDFHTLMAGFGGDQSPDLAASEIAVPGPDGNAIATHVIAPRGARGPYPAIVYLHGGAFVYGELDGAGPLAQAACAATGAVVISPNYRLAPEHPFPAGVEDSYAVVTWVHEHAAQLDIDPRRIALLGVSAGGALSAAACLMSRDRGGPPIAFQCLLIPMLDDRGDSASMRAITDRRVINGPGIRETWDVYLGSDRDPATTSPYAAPARADDLRRLPPAYVQTCGLDPLRDEALDYAGRLARADVAVEVHHVPGAWHFFEAFAPGSRLAATTTERWLRALQLALA